MAEVELSHLSKSYGATKALQDVSMTIPSGAFVVLLGPTGAGKTTTLRLIAGLDKPDAGDVRIAGQSVLQDTPAQRDVAMVFQQYSLYPHLTVRDNLAFPLRSPMIALPEDQIAKRVQEVAEVLRIPHKLDNKATALSGGEMQRVSIGRALVRNPRIYLMDEPLSSLDAKLRADLRIELKRIHADMAATFLYVTHDQIEAMTMATHVAVINKGRIEQFGPPQDLIDAPASAFVATFVGTPPNNLVPVVKNGTGHLVGGRHMAISPPMDDCLAMFRADTMGLSTEEGPRTLPMDLVEVSSIAGRSMATALSGDLRLTAILDRPPSVRVGDRVHVVLPARPATWFAPTGERIA